MSNHAGSPGSLKWEHRGGAPVVGLLAHESGVAIVQARSVGVFDGAGARTIEIPFSRDAYRAVRAVDTWLVGVARESCLDRLGKGKPSTFADGEGLIGSFAANADAIAVARPNRIELWSYAGKRKWSTPGGPWLSCVLCGMQVVALSSEGALSFFASKNGEALGTLHLASTDAAETFRLATIDPTRVVLALGEWVVLVDATTRKVIKRVRVRAKVTSLAADAKWIVAGLADGGLQAIEIEVGEPRGAFHAHEGSISGIALGKTLVFTADAAGLVRAWDRAGLAASARAASPVSAIASRGNLVAVGDSAGRVRILRGESEVGGVSLGEAVSAVHLTGDDGVIAATSRLVVHVPRPWTKPRPVVLEAPATAFAADDAYVFAGSESGKVDVYDLDDSSHVTTYALSEDAITALVRLPGSLLVVGTGALDGRVFVVDVSRAKVVHRLEIHEEAFGVTSLAADPRGRIVASGSDDGSVALIDPAKGKMLARLRVRETPASLAFDASGRRLGCTFTDATAALFTLGPGKAAMEDVGLRGASFVAWGGEAVFGLSDGRIERLAPS